VVHKKPLSFILRSQKKLFHVNFQDLRIDTLYALDPSRINFVGAEGVIQA